MAPFEALYGKRCRSPLLWDEIGERQMTGLEMILEMNDKVQLIRQRMKAAHDLQTSYAKKQRRSLEFQKGDKVYLKIYPFKARFDLACEGNDLFDMKYEPDLSHVLQLDEVELGPSLSYVAQPVCIRDLKEKM
ncbi:uncharacterized protein [Primulina eburnea]|uniref:uncharacterized protein n=1 Tax=Primulina eburnea TaxID=1245227 RepID=UPI003C6CAB30